MLAHTQHARAHANVDTTAHRSPSLASSDCLRDPTSHSIRRLDSARVLSVYHVHPKQPACAAWCCGGWPAI